MDDEKQPGPDPAERVGRAAGAAVKAVGRRLLRARSVREALRRAGEEAARPDQAGEDDPPNPV